MSKTITITINTGNAAFEDDWAHEVSNTLRSIASRFVFNDDLDGASVYDVNGNSCGKITVVDEDD